MRCSTTPHVHCIACSIFSHELEALRAAERVECSVTYVSSMLHLNPRRLQQRIDELLESERKDDAPVLLLFGDCCPYMLDAESQAGIARVAGINCCEVMLGSDRFRRLRREGAFFLMPEWTLRWREVFCEDLGLRGETARQFMREMHTRLVYVDTQQIPIPLAALEEVSRFTGLRWEAVGVSLDHLSGAIDEATKGFVADAV